MAFKQSLSISLKKKNTNPKKEKLRFSDPEAEFGCMWLDGYLCALVSLHSIGLLKLFTFIHTKSQSQGALEDSMEFEQK